MVQWNGWTDKRVSYVEVPGVQVDDGRSQTTSNDQLNQILKTGHANTEETLDINKEFVNTDFYGIPSFLPTPAENGVVIS